MTAILAQGERSMEDALEMRIAHADFMHVVERVADVVDAGAAHADALRHEARAAVQVELSYIGRVRRVGDEGQGLHRSVLQPDRDQARLVHPAGHLPVPQARQRAAQPSRVDPVGDAPARAAAAEAHHQAGLRRRASIARREDAKRAVVAVREAERTLRIVEAGRPH
jgi:hypothetical protein